MPAESRPAGGAGPRGRAQVPVSAVIAARNEEANIRGCVDALRWAAEVIVADDRSTDGTADMARAAGAVAVRADAGTIGGVRNVAIECAGHPWVLVVDADERATDELRDAVARAIATPTHDAYAVPRRNFFLGREIRHGGWQHDHPVRLVRRGMRYDASRVHERVVTTAPVGLLDAALLHYPYASLDQYFEKLYRYSRWWAEDRWARGRRASALDVVLRPPARFFAMYVLRGGLLDGAPGAVLAALAATSVLAKYARLWARQRGY